ncbi:hypothetical protein D8I24_0157 (plasmid) [Cupriavidus necator H850]|nr:hypothetical protein [Cupriavidus necator]KAI3611168.1 hypothetical protein D8I24_0157 [Cupriavidus necator H850]
MDDHAILRHVDFGIKVDWQLSAGKRYALRDASTRTGLPLSSRM